MLVTALAVVAIGVGAAFVRFVDIGHNPGGLYPDEAAEGLSALLLLQPHGLPPVFFHEDGGREALFAYIVAAAFRFFGASATVLRQTSAGIGVAGVLTTFVAMRRFGRGAALGATLWAAGSLWLICVSRDGMRNILCVLIGTLALAALLRWYDKPSRLGALLAGIYVALGLWTYQPLKLLPMLVILWLWQVRRRQPERFAAMRAHTWTATIAFAVVATPMLITAILDPGGYFGRGADVSVLNPSRGNVNLFDHTLRTLGQFFWVGDANQRHDVDMLPVLGWPLSALAALGVWRAWRHRQDAGHMFILLALPVFFIPPLIAVEGAAPHFLRNLGLAPYVAACIGLGCADVVNRARFWGGTLAARTLTVGLAVGLVALGAGSAAAYFSRPVAARYDAFTFDLVALANAAGSGPRTVVIIDDYASFDIRFLDDGNLPDIVSPPQTITNIGNYSSIVATSRDLIKNSVRDHALGMRLAASARPVAFDPNGKARVFMATP